MKRVEIFVPPLNDSFSKVALDGKEYQIRFTWNDTAARWTFGLYNIFKEPIIQGIRIVPCFPLNLQYVDERIPFGIFGVYTKLESVGREDFERGNAIFAYVPADGGVGL
ncbi:MAG: hypothetical protein LBD85_00140 [Oscillospiraceae bacterium]|jgi:hypothetical protein|nr:hypothetical protein [Oscillospiraceae bacterium]